MKYKVALVGEAYGKAEELDDAPFRGPAGKKLDSILKQVGLSREECYITTVLSEYVPRNYFTPYYKDKKLSKPSEALREHRECLIAELKKAAPNVVIALGAEALKVLSNWECVDIGKWRGSVMEFDGLKVIPTYSPDLLVRGGRLSKKVAGDATQAGTPVRPIMIMDFRKAVRESESPAVQYMVRERITGPSIQQAFDFLRDIQQNKRRIAVDIECERGIISCVGFATSPQRALCIPFIQSGYSDAEEAALRNLIGLILEDPSIPTMGQNFAFDKAWLARDISEVEGYDFDTLVAMNTVFPEFPQGLAFQTSLMTDIPYFKDDGKAHSKTKDYPKLWHYNCNDCLVTYECYEKLQEEIKRKDLEKQFKFTMDVYKQMYVISRRGLNFDHDLRKKWRVESRKKLKELRNEINTTVGREINPSSGPQIQAYVYKELGVKPYLNRSTRRPTMDENALKKHAVRDKEISPLFEQLLRYRKENKFYTTYLAIKSDDDSRVRCSYGLAETGRLKSSGSSFFTGTNLQNQPPRMRPCYRADPGTTFIELDLGQAEARVVAYDSGDENYMKLFEEGGDIHVANAANIFGLALDKVSYRERQLGKKISHATNYGMGPGTMVESIIKELGTDYAISLGEAKKFQTAYHEAYPRIKEWHARIRGELDDGRILKNCFGRRRFFMGPRDDKLFKEAYAFIPQSTVADLLNTSILKWKHYAYDDIYPILLQVHDSVIIQIPEKEKAPLQQLKECFQLPIKVNGVEIIIPIDVKIGKRWGELEEI